MTYLPDLQPWTVQPHHLDGVDMALTSPAGVNHLGFNRAGAQWLHLQPSGPPARITAGEAIMLRPTDIDQIIKLSWSWAQSNASHPRCMELSDEVSAGAKTVLMHFAQAG